MFFFKQTIVVLVFAIFLPALGRGGDLTGTWEGVMGTGTHQFRVAFVLEKDHAEYHNIDDGIHGEPMTVERAGESSLRARTEGGGMLSLKPLEGGHLLVGIFTQGTGLDSQQSLVGENQSYPVTLHQGEDYLYPRLGSDGHGQTRYRYLSPKRTRDGWETGDLRQTHADLPQIEGAVEDVLQSKFPYLHSLLVVKDGKLVLDEYFYGYGPDDSHPVQSITKSIFSLLFGIITDHGFLNPDQKLYDFSPTYRQKPGWDARKNRITLKNLLTMTSGLGCDDFKDSTACSWDMVQSKDWGGYVLSLPLDHAPGSHFAYCGACLSPLTTLLERETDLKVDWFAQRYLFDPLRIQAPPWWEGPDGFHSPAFGLSLRPRDMAKIGLLVLRKGKWNGRQVIPEKWIEESTASHIPASMTGQKADYGYLWWGRDVLWHGKKLRVLDAWGVGGQHIFIVPVLDLVCVMTGGNYKDSKSGAKVFKLFQEEVLAAF